MQSAAESCPVHVLPCTGGNRGLNRGVGGIFHPPTPPICKEGIWELPGHCSSCRGCPWGGCWQQGCTQLSGAVQVEPVQTWSTASEFGVCKRFCVQVLPPALFSAISAQVAFAKCLTSPCLGLVCESGLPSPCSALPLNEAAGGFGG